jgi:hypothetical protein
LVIRVHLLTQRAGVARITEKPTVPREISMPNIDLDQRVAALEEEVAKLNAALGTASREQYPWWREIAGIFADDPAFGETMKLGRQWRESFRRNPPGKKASDGRTRHGSPQPARKKRVRRKPGFPSSIGST